MTASVTRTRGAFVMLALLCLFFAVVAPKFATTANLENVLRQIAPVVIVGAAVTLVMVSGHLDLSVGGVLALSGVLAAWLTLHGVPPALSFVLGTLAGSLVGLINGLLIVGLGLNAVIATLGTLYISRGIANLITDGVSINFLPGNFSELGTGVLAGIPIPVIVMAAVVAGFIVLERRTLVGKYSVAIGSNFEGARLSGIRVNRHRMALFTIAGTASGLAGVLVASRLDSGQPTVGVGFEFDVIVAAVLGGTSLAGGVGTVVGTCAGAAIVGVINNALNLLNVQTFWQTIIQGLILIIAVAADDVLRAQRFRPSWLRGGIASGAAATAPSHAATDRPEVGVGADQRKEPR